MDNLPIELLSFIFKHLGLVDLLRSRSVCKKWRFFIDEQKIKELTIFDSEFEFKNWPKTNQLINLDNAIQLVASDEISMIEFSLINLNLLTDLKRLKICFHQSIMSLFTEFLYKFTKLEQLDLDLNFNGFELEHPNLRIISIVNNHHLNLKIDAPKLETLIYRGCIRSFELVYPNTLIGLHIRNCVDHDELDLTSYSNIELLSCYYLKSNQNIISVLPKLKEIHCHYDFLIRSLFIEHSLIKNVMNNLLEENQNLKRSVKIYFQDLLLSNEALKPFNESLDVLRDELFLQIKNYDLLSKSNLDKLNYTILMERFVKSGYFLNSSIDNKLPTDFFNKFSNIKYIYTNEIQDQTHFSWFLENCTNLIGLFMNNSLIDQNLFNKLPNLCQHLSHFRINLTDNLILNFDFILKFNRLLTFETNQRVLNALVIVSLRTLKHLRNIRFKDYNSNNFKIKKNGFKFDLKFYRILNKKIVQKITKTQLNLNNLILKLSEL